ncbi:MAG: response regulator transcription factor [Bacteroidales bacterium]
MKSNPNILLVEDDRNFGSVLKSYLELNDFDVVWVDDGKHALHTFAVNKFDLCVLDIMLPNTDGFSIAESIKQLNADVPFIFLTAKTLKEDILKGYRYGADDYLTKPFDSEVLICKIEAIIHRRSSQKEMGIKQNRDVYNLGKYIFDYKLRTLRFDDDFIKLSPKEAELLKMLCMHINDVMPRKLALEALWGEESYFTTRSMDVFIAKLRKYLNDDPHVEIMNVHGNGFRLVVPKRRFVNER